MGETRRRIFGQFAIFMNRHSGSRLIRIQSSQKGTVIPSSGCPGSKMCHMTTVMSNPGSPRQRNPVPRNKCRQKSCPLLNHFRRLPEISAQIKGWCPLLADFGRSWQILSTSVNFFLNFYCNYVNLIAEIYCLKLSFVKIARW